jgi:hypothetical protein
MKLYNTKEIADFLQLCPRSINNLRNKQIIPFLKIGATVRFQPEKVLKALEQYEIPAEAK